jgi:periplasmic protein TonB
MYSPKEVAAAAGVPLQLVVDAIGGDDVVIGHADAVRLGRALLIGWKRNPTPLSGWSTGARLRRRVFPMAVSSGAHAAIVASLVFMTGFGLAPTSTTLAASERADDLRLVFLTMPGPGGGGGGGGLRQNAPAPKALRKGTHSISSPIPERRPPPPIVPAAKPAEPPPPPPIKAEPLPVIVAPIIMAPSDNRDRIGVLQQAGVEVDSHGPGKDGGAGTGTGAGLGQGDGLGIGAGFGGGTGGGPFRPGSGIEPPRLVREVKADYTDEARRRGISGDVVLEIVVRRDGSVGEDIKILKGLPWGLNDRAVNAVRQWRFTPARRQGAPVDVIVEAAVEFKLR